MQCLKNIMAACVAIATVCASEAALAGSACVSCDSPAAVYSCSVAPDANGDIAMLSDRRLQFRCIEEIAQQYRHATCSVKRNQLGPCTGQVHMLSASGATPPPVVAATPGEKTAGERKSGAQKDGEQTSGTNTSGGETSGGKTGGAPSDRSAEPKTVVELAKRTADTTKEEMNKSAKKVSNAARSTWRCLSTLFSDC